MSNGEGLKAQWKVTEPRPAAPDSKGGDFRDEYKHEMGGAEANLKVIARDGNSETLTRFTEIRVKRYTEYQKVIAYLESDPAKAEKAGEVLVAGVTKLNKDTTEAKKNILASKKAWEAVQSDFEAARDKIEEMDIWGHPKAAKLLEAAGTVDIKVASKNWTTATKYAQSIVTHLSTTYPDFLRQKEAEPLYKQERTTFDTGYKTACEAPEPSDPMSELVKKIGALIPTIDEAANKRDYEAARKTLVEAQKLLDELTTLVEDGFRWDYIEWHPEAFKGAMDALEADTPTKKIAELQKKIPPAMAAMESAAKSGDYDKACDLLMKVEDLTRNFSSELATWQKAKTDYEAVRAAMKSKLLEMIAPAMIAYVANLKDFKELLKEIVADNTAIEAPVAEQDYVKALELATKLKAKLDAFVTKYEAYEKAMKDYTEAAKTFRPKLKDALALKTEDPEIKAVQEQLQQISDRLSNREAANDYVAAWKIYDTNLEKLLTQVTDRDKGLKERKEYEAALPALEAKLKQALEGPYLEKHAEARGAVAKAEAEMKGDAAGLQFVDALAKQKALTGQVDKYLADIEKDVKEIVEMIKDVRKRMDAAGYFDSDDTARKIVGQYSDEMLSHLPADLRSRLMDEMKGGYKSDDDVKALAKLTSVPPAGSGPLDKETIALIKRVETALNSSGWLDEDDKARKEVEALTQSELAKLPKELLARVREALASGYESGGDTKAIKIIDLSKNVSDTEDLIAQLENMNLSIMSDKGKTFVKGELEEIKGKLKEALPKIDADELEAAEKLLDEAATIGKGVMAKIQLHSGFPDPKVLEELMQGPNGAEVLDEVIASMPDAVSHRAMEVAIEKRFGKEVRLMENDDDWEQLGDTSDKSLKKVYELMAALPASHVEGNEEIDKIDRISGKQDGGVYYGGKWDEILLKCGKLDETKLEPLGLDEAVHPDCAVAPGTTAPPVFSFTVLHEVGHAVDSKSGHMKGKQGDTDHGGWIEYGSDFSGIAEVFAKAFEYDVGYITEILSLKEPAKDDYPDAPEKLKKAEPEKWEAIWEARRVKARAHSQSILAKAEPWYRKKASDIKVGDRVYQQAYKDGRWVSYLANAKHKTGFTKYQFRAPGEWFAELYAAYHSKVLPPSHPANSWLKELDGLK